jgi:membrane-bound lytic murein transglycosylase D
MRQLTTKLLITLLFIIAFSTYAEAQGFIKSKKSRKLSTKEQLLIEQEKNDSLINLINEYKEREEKLQNALELERNKEEKAPINNQFSVEYSPSMVDSLTDNLKQQQVNEAFQNFFNDYICEPAQMSTDTAMDSLYAERLKTLVSPIHLPYNSVVRTFIKRYTDGSGLMSRVLALAQYYFPMIDEELLRAELPVELHAMAIIESALQATAMSRVGAGGLWQFMPRTARAYGLEVNSMIDERFDPIKSTKAACKYMKDLYKMYNDWSLAIAAYNCGPGNVNKALARAGGNPQSFWEVYWYLPSETRGYVPAFIAASYAFAYHKAHNITIADSPLPIAVDTIHVDKLMHLDQVSSTIDLPKEVLKSLNPQYKLDIIPASTKSYSLVLPTNRISEFISNQEAIHAKDSIFLKEYLNPSVVAKKMEQTSVVYHRVKSGETLGAIARRYRVTTSQIMRWNGLKNANRLSIGQRLRIEKR